jgi:hypothetical protein
LVTEKQNQMGQQSEAQTSQTRANFKPTFGALPKKSLTKRLSLGFSLYSPPPLPFQITTFASPNPQLHQIISNQTLDLPTVAEMAGQSDSNMSLFSPEEVPSLLSTHDLQIYAWLFMLGCCFFFFLTD